MRRFSSIVVSIRLRGYTVNFNDEELHDKLWRMYLTDDIQTRRPMHKATKRAYIGGLLFPVVIHRGLRMERKEDAAGQSRPDDLRVAREWLRNRSAREKPPLLRRTGQKGQRVERAGHTGVGL